MKLEKGSRRYLRSPAAPRLDTHTQRLCRGGQPKPHASQPPARLRPAPAGARSLGLLKPQCRQSAYLQGKYQIRGRPFPRCLSEAYNTGLSCYYSRPYPEECHQSLQWVFLQQAE